MLVRDNQTKLAIWAYHVSKVPGFLCMNENKNQVIQRILITTIWCLLLARFGLLEFTGKLSSKLHAAV
jgi:hypothetical protein